ncbi:NAD-dependent epimerase/dehydratase family protein [Micromonospora cathayae]|uniref:NAD(P)-dependent oxidoreductase n=1 Tax=Micromonospora cathayae TaxID=3028804 RepID=A0ABY7ZN14_9ACTN|nr:NAD(P)-dependent oxidoreductase [Micromonospora sp. HUAS 3]WDZ83468.1 NAD(P)-dependent oxidoreductase [Micromonospora sp. HUAS 3]
MFGTVFGPRLNIAVLGGTGWVGRHLCALLAEEGHRVLAVARNPVRHRGGPGFRALDLDTATTATIADLLYAERIGVVVNATDGANATDGWDRSPAELACVNVDAVHRLLAAVTRLPWTPRLVHIGTIHEYGPVPPGTAVDEATPPRPATAYARTKLAGSQAVLDASARGAVDGIVLRLTNVCGPYPSPVSFPGKLLDLLRDAAAGRTAELTVTGDRRDFVDVRDVAEATARAVRSPVAGCAVNIGQGVAVEIRDLVTHLIDVAELPAAAVAVRERPVSGFGGDWIQSDIRLARRLLGWRPRFGLRESLRDMWVAGMADPDDDRRPVGVAGGAGRGRGGTGRGSGRTGGAGGAAGRVRADGGTGPAPRTDDRVRG